MKTVILIMSIFSFLFPSKSSIGFDVTDLSPDKHNEYYEIGTELISPFMYIHNQKAKAAQQSDILKGIAYLDAVTKINPNNWAAFWIKGKGYQALNESVYAYKEFKNSYSIQKSNPDVARELMVECLNIGKREEGIEVAIQALSLDSNNSGLNANLGLAYLIGGDISQAIKYVEKAIELAPDDQINRNLLNIIEQVNTGKLKQPKKYSDLFS